MPKKSKPARVQPADDPPIRDGTLPGSWSPLDVVLIYWDLDINEGNATVSADSCVYSYNDVTACYGSIAGFAWAVSKGPLTVPLTHTPPAQNPDQFPLPWDFAIERSCYVVFALRNPYHSWIYQQGLQAVTFKQNPDGWYSDLLHIRKSDGVTKQYAPGNCTVCYFSARVEPSNGQGTDPFTMHFVFQLGTGLIPRDFDPAIKNKGHNHFFKHLPKCFTLPSTPMEVYAETRKLLDKDMKPNDWI